MHFGRLQSAESFRRSGHSQRKPASPTFVLHRRCLQNTAANSPLQVFALAGICFSVCWKMLKDFTSTVLTPVAVSQNMGSWDPHV